LVAIHREAAITGIGETEYSKASGMSAKALQVQAVLRAIEDAGLEPRDIDGIIPNGAPESPSAEDFGNNLGLPVINYTVTLHMGGASGTAGVFCAAMAVACGVARHVVVVSGRNGYSGARVSDARSSRGLAPVEQKQSMTLEFEAPFGLMVPMQYYSLLAQRHMFQYGTTSQQMGAVAVAMRKHAALNDKAIMKHPITLEDHQASRMLSDPFHLFDCCIETDGATAILVSSAEAAADTRHKPVSILGGGFAHPDSPGCVSTRPDLTLLGLVKAAPKAFAMAGISPKDLKLACLYDAFTIVPILHLENLGICGPGEGGPFVENGRIELGGELPINPHGGLHSQAHSMSGLNHQAEAVKQLRRSAGKAQVADPEPCVVTGFGGFGAGSLVILAT